MSKPVYKSKINLFMVGLAALGILQIVQGWYKTSNLTVEGFIALAIAIIVFLLRTFGNSTPIDAPKPFRPKATGK